MSTSKAIVPVSKSTAIVHTSPHSQTFESNTKPKPTADYVPEPYKVSTITAIGSLNSEMELPLLFNNLPILDPSDHVSNGFVFAEFGRKQGAINHRGHHKKVALAAKRPPPKTRRFDNQVTVVYRKRINVPPEEYIPLSYKDDFQYVPPDRGQFVMANMKIFNTGNVQITGLKYINHGQEYIETIAEVIQLLCRLGIRVAKEPEKVRASDYSVQLINTDFRIGFDVKREKLYNIMLTKYKPKDEEDDKNGNDTNDAVLGHIYTTFESGIYPGVKIHYKWNTNQPPNAKGICCCSKFCSKGKGTGDGDGQCKRVTIAVFQSGCIIITGAHTQEQIDSAYMFINNTIKDHFNDVYKPSIEERLAELKKLKLNKDEQPQLPAPKKKLALTNKREPVLALTHAVAV